MDLATATGEAEPGHDDGPRVYVACLAAYNNGKLYGAWIDANQDADDIWTDVQAMLAASPESDAEEWAIHDCDGFYGLRLGESASFETVAELAGLLTEHGAAYAAYASNIGADYADADGFKEAYAGEWRSEREYAEELFDSIDLAEPGSLAERYFDYEAFTRDLFMTDYWSAPAPDGGVFVFHNV